MLIGSMSVCGKMKWDMLDVTVCRIFQVRHKFTSESVRQLKYSINKELCIKCVCVRCVLKN